MQGQHLDNEGQWVQLDATKWMDDNNTIVQLTTMAPKMLRQKLKASINRQEQRHMASKLGNNNGDNDNRLDLDTAQKVYTAKGKKPCNQNTEGSTKPIYVDAYGPNTDWTKQDTKFLTPNAANAEGKETPYTTEYGGAKTSKLRKKGISTQVKGYSGKPKRRVQKTHGTTMG